MGCIFHRFAKTDNLILNDKTADIGSSSTIDFNAGNSSDPKSAVKPGFSWDNKHRAKEMLANVMVEDFEGTVIQRMPGTLDGEQFILNRCQGCVIQVFDHCSTVMIDDCTDCVIFIGSIKNSIFIRDCINCHVMTACQQFRMRDCRSIEVYLYCLTNPIIEASTEIKFGCFQYYYEQLSEHFNNAGLDRFQNKWYTVQDFSSVKSQSHWSFIQSIPDLNAFLPKVAFSTDSQEKEHSYEQNRRLNASIDYWKSVVPVTHGSYKCELGDPVFILLLNDQLINKVQASIWKPSLQETLLPIRTERKRITGNSISKIILKPCSIKPNETSIVTGLELRLVKDNHDYSQIVQTLLFTFQNIESVYISTNIDAAYNGIDSFFNESMQM